LIFLFDPPEKPHQTKAMATFRTITSHFVALPRNDVDTDQIIPARYLKTTSKAGLDAHLFADWRYAQDGSPRADFVLNAPASQGAQILVAADNFGCGSSREHAAWALTAWGFRAIVARSFADIFRNNALKNGLLPVAVSGEVLDALLDAHRKDQGVALTVDLESETLTQGDRIRASFSIDPFAKHCLLSGIDELEYLLSHAKEIAAYEAAQSVSRSV
jgi:3-isopropylmalate/(R)-2-methylmalate dehydratase small subunit